MADGEMKVPMDTGDAEGEMKVPIDTGDSEGEMKVPIDTGDAEGEMKVPMDTGDAEGEMKVPIDTGDSEGEMKVPIDTGDAEGEMKVPMDTGDAFFEAGNYIEAVALYTQAIELDSSNFNATNLYSKRAAAYLYLSLADTDSYIEEDTLFTFDTGPTKFNPAVAKGHYSKACVLEAMEKYDEALAEVRIALLYDSQNTRYSEKISWFELQMQKEKLQMQKKNQNESTAWSFDWFESFEPEKKLQPLEITMSPYRAELAQLYVLWDIESLNVLSGYDLNCVVPSIIRWLDSLKYQGVFEIEAVVAQYTRDRLPDEIRVGLEAKGLKFSAVGKTGSDVADREITRRVWAWSKKCQRGLIVLFTCDGDYGSVLKKIQSCYIHTRLVYLPSSLNKKVEKYKTTAGNHSWDDVFSRGAKPELSSIRVTGEPVTSTVPNIIWAGTTAEGEIDWSVGRGRELSHWPALTGIVNGTRVFYRTKKSGGGGGESVL